MKRAIHSLISKLHSLCWMCHSGRAFFYCILNMSKICQYVAQWLTYLPIWNGTSLFYDTERPTSMDCEFFTDARNLYFTYYFQSHWCNETYFTKSSFAHLTQDGAGVTQREAMLLANKVQALGMYKLTALIILRQFIPQQQLINIQHCNTVNNTARDLHWLSITAVLCYKNNQHNNIEHLALLYQSCQPSGFFLTVTTAQWSTLWPNVHPTGKPWWLSYVPSPCWPCNTIFRSVFTLPDALPGFTMSHFRELDSRCRPGHDSAS